MKQDSRKEHYLQQAHAVNVLVYKPINSRSREEEEECQRETNGEQNAKNVDTTFEACVQRATPGRSPYAAVSDCRSTPIRDSSFKDRREV